MKRIVHAWIEQILQFDTKLECLAYIEEIKKKNQKFKIIKQERDKCGVVTLQIRKQYNKNNFPDQKGSG